METATFVEPNKLDLTDHLIRPIFKKSLKKKDSNDTLRTVATGMSGASGFLKVGKKKAKDGDNIKVIEEMAEVDSEDAIQEEIKDFD